MALGWRGQYYRYNEYFLNILNLYKRRTDLRAFVEVILSILTVAIFLVFALRPTALTIISLVQEIKVKQTTLANLNQKINDLQQAQTIYAANQNLISNVDTAIATKPEPDVISKQIIGLASKDSVSVLGLSIGQVALIGKETPTGSTSMLKPLPGNAREMPISISVQGSYPNVLSFVGDFGNLRITSKIDQVMIDSSETNGEKNVVVLMSARVPFLGE